MSAQQSESIEGQGVGTSTRRSSGSPWLSGIEVVGGREDESHEGTINVFYFSGISQLF